MKKYWKSLLVLFVLAAGLGWFVAHLIAERAAMTASATATVTRVAFDPDEESSSLDETDIDYRFEAGGRPVTGTDSLPGDRAKDYPVGREVAICYQPDEPATSRVNPDGGACGG